jgi:tungstate transport system substrate-binding protein
MSSLSNGGAGAVGLIRALATDYLSTLPSEASITWTSNHSRNTQLALFGNHIDIALTYERDQEMLAASEGWSNTAGCVFHDHFVLAGPASDPAGVRSTRCLADALRRIASQRSLFHNRADASATMWKERSLWLEARLRPWEDWNVNDWYRSSLMGPADALKSADAAGAYLITDRSTLLHQTGLKNVSKTTIFVEPEARDDILMNSCFALYAASADEEKARAVSHFIGYMRSERGQHVISNYGKVQVGLPLFAAVEEGYAHSKLKDGRPVGGVWLLGSRL